MYSHYVGAHEKEETGNESFLHVDPFDAWRQLGMNLFDQESYAEQAGFWTLYQTSHDTTSTYQHVAAFNTSQPPLIAGLPKERIDPSALVFRKVVHALDLYFVPAVAIFGIIGNIISFYVFIASYLRQMSSSIYLAGLSLSDTVFLSIMLISWSNNVGWDLYHRPGWCQLLVYLSYISSFLSVWYVVSFTVERYLALQFPFRKHILCTTKRAKIVVITLAVVAATLYNYALWTSEVIDMYDRPFCFVSSTYYQMVADITNVDTILTLIIPTLIIAVCNTRILYALARFYRSAGASPTHGLEYPRRIMRKNHIESNMPCNSLQMQVTKMLVGVSTVFLLCNIPSHGIRLYAFIMSKTVDGYLPSHKFLLTQKIFQFLFYSNFAINIVLYNFSGKTFRKATAQLLRTTKKKIATFIQMKYTSLRSKSRARRTRRGMIVCTCKVKKSGSHSMHIASGLPEPFDELEKYS